MARWFQQPLLHFLLLGGCVFALHAWVAAPEAPERRIVIPADEIARLRAEEATRGGVEPTRQRLEQLVEARLEEEILYREALALGLDDGDVIIRRRLAQKMRFLSEGLARPEPPTESALRGFFDQQRDAYLEPARFGFTHVFFSQDQRGDAAFEQALERLNQLRASGSATAHGGDRFMLRRDYAGLTRQEIGNLFGDAFADALASLEVGSWQGPVASSFGLHLILVTEHQVATSPTFEQVRERLASDYVSQRMRRDDERFRAELRASYDLQIEWPEALKGQGAGAASATARATP